MSSLLIINVELELATPLELDHDSITIVKGEASVTHAYSLISFQSSSFAYYTH